MVVRGSTPLGCYLNVAVSSWVVQNDVDTETSAVPDLRRPWNRDSKTACGELRTVCHKWGSEECSACEM